MEENSLPKYFNILFFLIFFAIILFINVGSYGVIETSDARYAEIAREMFISGDYIHPNLLNIHHYHKPPFTYQITALGYEIFGVNPFAARFFLQISVLLQLLLVYKIAMLLFNDKKTAVLSSITYFTLPLVLISSRTLTTDSFLATFAISSIYFWIKYRKSGNYINLYLFYLSFAMGFLTKGPVIFIIPLVFIIFYNFTEKSKNKLSKHHLFAFILFLLVGFSWYLYLVFYNFDFLNYFIGKQTVERFSKNVFDRTEPFWYFIVIAPLLGAPWFLFLPYLIKLKYHLFKFKSVYFVLFMSFFLPLIFFSMSSSKRPLYILPFYSLVSILITRLVLELEINKLKIINKVIFIFSIIVSAVFFVVPIINYKYSMSKLFILISLISLLLIYFINKKLDYSLKPFLMSLIAASLLITGSSNVLALNGTKINSPKFVTDFIIKNNLDDRDVLIYNRRLPSIAFGLNKSVISLNYGHYTLKRETQFEDNLDWKKYLINMKDEKGVEYIKNILENKPTILVAYKHFPKGDRAWLLKYYKHSKKFDKWIVYY
jgi:4-amino-4-deoxy-L-arabinose transferase